MKRRRWLGYLAVAGGAALVGYAVLAQPSDEERIRGQLEALAEAVSSPEPVTNVVFRANYLKERFDELLTADVHVDVPEVGSLPSDHRGLALAAARVQTGIGVFDVTLGSLDIDVGVEEPGKHAVEKGVEEAVDGAARDERADEGARGAAVGDAAVARGRVKVAGSSYRREERDVVFALRKDGGTWRVSSVRVSAPEHPDL